MKLLLFLETRARVLVDRTQTVASHPTKRVLGSCGKKGLVLEA